MQRLSLCSAVFLAAVGAGCGNKGPGGSVTLKGEGATFPAPLYQRWFADYNKKHPNVRPNYNGTGSGAGITQFQQELVDFAGSDSAMNEKEIKGVPADRQGAVLIPATAGNIVLAYNLPSGPKQLRLSRKTYVGIFQGKIKKWNDPAIAASNPGEKLPDLPVLAARRAEGSGTTFVFTTHLSAISPEWKNSLGAGKEVKWSTDLVGKPGNDGVAAYVAQNEGAIGYMEYGFASKGKLAMALLENKSGAYVAPTPESGNASLATVTLPPNLVAWISDPEGKDCYPIVTLTWILCYKNYADAAKAAAIRDLLGYCLGDGQAVAPELGYLPLPAKIATASKDAVATIGPAAAK
jgi:phosphate transport system substrate-binding protein